MRRLAKNSDEGSGAGITKSPPDTTDSTLSSRVYALMRSDVLEMRLQPGSRLVIDILRERYSAGLSPLREALSRLLNEGLVVGEEWRGFRVAPMTEEDLYDLTDTRREIEVLTVTRSVARGDDRWAADLTRVFRQMSQAGSKRSNRLDEWSDHHQSFHGILVRECGSPRLIKLRQQLFDHFMRYIRLAPQRARLGFIDDTAHQELFDTAIARDVQKCAALIRTHITVLDSLVASLRLFNEQAATRSRR
jgi:GntR family transcriptional regulator, carbon starvation induced regulator